MKKANENVAYFRGRAKEDKALFVENVGWLLSQTREGVKKCEYIPLNETVLITFDNDYVKQVNINLNSYLAIVSDIVKAVNR